MYIYVYIGEFYEFTNIHILHSSDGYKQGNEIKCTQNAHFKMCKHLYVFIMHNLIDSFFQSY